ncbi:ABC transporter, partial [Mycoplasmopsis pullorum]|uniref:ABC transporter ATP-binding protein n=1 Tax=Mycoplasmopsis pullorum TaxID=48003 RepID=UPI0015D5B2C1
MSKKRKRPPIKPGSFKKLLKFIWKYNKVSYFLVFLTIFISSGIFIYAQSFLGNVVFEKYLVPYFITGHFDNTGFTNSMLILGGMFLISIACSLISSQIAVVVTHRTIKKLRDQLYGHIQKLPLGYFDTQLKGNITSIFTNDIDALRDMLSQSIPQIFNAIFSILFSLVMMIYYSWFLTILVLLMVVILMFLAQILGKKSIKYFSARQSSLGTANGYLTEMIEGIKIVKVFNYEKKSVENLKVKNDKLYENDYKSKFWVNIIMPVLMNMGNVNFALMAVIGGTLFYYQNQWGTTWMNINIGTLITFLQYSRSFIAPIGQVSQQLNSISLAIAGFSRVVDVLERIPEESNGNVKLLTKEQLIQNDSSFANSNTNLYDFYWKVIDKVTQQINYIPALGAVKFENVSFSYSPEKKIIDNFNLDVKPGQKVALVGSTGAGKTTIANLLSRFYETTEGHIYLDGIDIKDINKDDLRKSMGLVLQDTSLFSKSVNENISYGLDHCEDNVIVSAATVANANDFITMLHDGYNTILENSAEGLSQGQKQLLSIARTSALNPVMLILDEATSTIDTQTEKLIQQALDNLMHQRTSFVIAHRLS